MPHAVKLIQLPTHFLALIRPYRLCNRAFPFGTKDNVDNRFYSRNSKMELKKSYIHIKCKTKQNKTNMFAFATYNSTYFYIGTHIYENITAF